jgi:hypothetical protein
MNHVFQKIEKLRMILIQPTEESAAVMEDDLDPGMLGRCSEEGEIGICINPLDNAVEIP